jgi:hypothetical protein
MDAFDDDEDPWMLEVLWEAVNRGIIEPVRGEDGEQLWAPGPDGCPRRLWRRKTERDADVGERPPTTP